MKKVFAFFSLLLILSSRSMIKPASPRGAKPVVLVSVAPYIMMVKQIAGSTVEVRSAVPQDVDPHNWEPSYKDMDRLQGASLWFTLGEEFEPKLQKKLEDGSNPPVVHNLAMQVDTLEDPYHHHGHNHGHSVDTHIWLDPILDIEQAKFIAHELTTLQPKYKSLYEKRLNNLTKKLLILNENITEALAPYKGKILLTTHGAYTYYCHRYGLKQLVIEPSGGKEARTADVGALVSKIRRKLPEIVGVFLQPQQPNKAAQMLAKKFDLPEHMVDPYREDYIATMEDLTRAITNGQGEKTAFVEEAEGSDEPSFEGLVEASDGQG